MDLVHTAYVDLLKEELTPAVGCTEPIAIALACAKAREVLGCEGSEVERIELSLSANVIKNAMGVGIPGTGMVGIPIAAAMGAVGGHSEHELEVLSSVSPEAIAAAKVLVRQSAVSSERCESGAEKLFVKSRVYSGEGYAEVTIERDHQNITSIVKNGRELLSKQLPSLDTGGSGELETTVSGIVSFISSCDPEQLAFLRDGALMNRAIADEGLLKDYGLRVGRTIHKNIERNIITDDMEHIAVALASAAADARMAGCMLPVMTNSGSGNQGITATLPVVAVAEKLDSSQHQLIRALALSNLIAVHIRRKTGKLTALCGATTAAIGAGCGMVYLMGGSLAEINAVINNMIGDLAGMICDGAKHSCSLKVASSVESAFRSAMLALENLQVSCYEGIVEQDVEQSIANLVALSKEGMEAIDTMVLHMMEQKRCQSEQRSEPEVQKDDSHAGTH